jgi:Gpi18-like mannosyltransferase
MTNRSSLWVLKSFLVWRLLIFLPVFLGLYLISLRSGFIFKYPWANFDGIHYLSIAQNGYVNQAAFFPLYPLLIGVFGGGFWAGFFLANLSFFLALIIFYKLIKLDYKEKIAQQSILFMLIFPTAFFWGSVYVESLFILLLLLAFYLARKGHWLTASVAGMLLTATRLVGIFILLALIYEFIKQKPVVWKSNFFYLSLVPLGLILYSLFNLKKWGDAFYFIRAHGELANSRSVDTIILFPQTMYRYLKILTTLPINQYEWWIASLEIGLFIFVFYLLYLGFKQKIRASYLLFSILAFFLPASSGTFTGLPRYVLVLFPIYLALALSKNKLLKTFYFLISPVLLFILLMFFARGYFVA